MGRIDLARAISIAGHPALVLPFAVAAAVEGDATAGLRAATPVVLAAGAVMAYSLVQTKRGRWTHVDASVRDERRQLNLFITGVLSLGATALWSAGQPRPVVAGMACSAVLVGVAHALRRWLKASLHVAFAVFSAAFLWPRTGAIVAVLGLAAAVAWSRLALARHTRIEVAVGALLGLAVSVLFLATALPAR